MYFLNRESIQHHSRQLLLLIALLFPIYLFGQEPLVDKVVTKLQQWEAAYPFEKAYLHLDKPYYALGDTIWFKAYVTKGSKHELSQLSGALYVDLINGKDSLVTELKLPLVAGMATGNLTLSDELKEGSYRIRAYTRWMMNAGPDYFFDRSFSIGDGYTKDVIPKVSYKYTKVNNTDVITAILNYKDDKGVALSGKKVHFSIITSGKNVAKGNGQTDSNGNLEVKMSKNEKSDAQKSYIETVIDLDDKKHVTNSFPVKASVSLADVQFFPEGGNLVNGVKSRLSFKATGLEGLGVSLKGVIVDDQGHEVQSFSTTYAGMGLIDLMPEEGRSYTAKVTHADGSIQVIPLPKALSQGYVLAVYNNPDVDSVLVRVNTNETTYGAGPALSLLVQTGGALNYSASIKIIRPMTSIWIDKKELRTGIVQFTLFSDRGEPLNERVAFISKADQLEINMSTAKLTYRAKEKVEVALESKDSKGRKTAGSFSIAVTDISKLPIDESRESTILSNLLLSSDLKGYIEKPNYYFMADSTGERSSHLDLLMMSQGYRRFVWKEVLADTQPKPMYSAEKITTEIAGTMLNYAKKPVVEGKVKLFNLEYGIVRDTVSDSNGRFVFDNLRFKDGVRLSVLGRTANDKSRLDIILDKEIRQEITANKNAGDIENDISGAMEMYLKSKKKEEKDLIQSGRLNRTQNLAEVNITAKSVTKVGGTYGLSVASADYSYVMTNGDKCATLALCLSSRFGAIIFEIGIDGTKAFIRRDGEKIPLQVILDGIKIDTTDISDVFEGNLVYPEDVVRIDLFSTSLAMTSYLGGPTLVITTNGKRGQRSASKDVVTAKPRGFSLVKEFYSPQYDKPEANSITDLRTTIYWNPTVLTGAEGKTTFQFFNALDPGTYRVVAEGINAQGEIGRKIYTYKVQ